MIVTFWSSKPQNLLIAFITMDLVSCTTLERQEKPGQKRVVSQAPFQFPIEEVVDEFDDEVDLFPNSPSGKAQENNIRKTWRYKNHKVAPGDWLSKLAVIYYGDKNKWHVILSANPDINPDLILPGQILKIPEI